MHLTKYSINQLVKKPNLKPFYLSINQRVKKPNWILFICFLNIESSVPIDCSEQPGRYYVCPHGEGVPCVDGPSMLCDLKADCPGGNDEKEDACSKCFTLFSISYTADAVPLKKFCALWYWSLCYLFKFIGLEFLQVQYSSKVKRFL